jgi:thiamine-phosphate pyrophosphorylase
MMLHADVLRILDANFNRAREALRVNEDYARFALNDDELCGTLKAIRHDLSALVRLFADEAILHRNTPGDVGTDNKTATEQSRADLADVVTAAGKRFGEAIRAIEECLKAIDPASAASAEKIRYRFYDMEQRLARTLRPGKRFEGVRLYVLVSESFCKRPWLETVREVIEGGADCIQLREKELDGGELLRRARQFVELCREHQVISIINDRPDIAVLSGADGVHVGQKDLSAVEARKIVGSRMIVGVSTHNIAQARQAVRDGADYIGVGPVFHSTTKPRDIHPGLPYAREIVDAIRISAVAIAGISQGNLDEVLASGIKAVAVSSAIISSDNPRDSARWFKVRLQQHARSTDGQ